MSTMLKTAAMSLLSKTLQTFLYKYLLDVDVEGVAMPSFMDADGHSGWGVRLCNVRLREGVELMTLPGKRKVKRRKPMEPKAEAADALSKEKEVQEESANEKEDTSRTSDGISQGTAQPVDGNAVTEDACAEDRERRPIQMDYTSDGDSDVSDGAQRRSYSLACFSRSSAATKISSKDVVSVSSSAGSLSRVQAEKDMRQNLVRVSKSGQAKEINGAAAGSSKKDEDIEEQASSVSDEADEDEFVEIEKDMILRLGNGGRIGVLDVRLVGKELHVSVEDAFLVVEACQMPEETDNKADAGKTTEGVKVDDAKAKDSATEKKAASKKSDQDKPVGDRILENSPLARAISAIPHLFLRDCRVQLVVREDDVENETRTDEISEKDSVIDFGVELLSVTSGEDFLAHFRSEDDPSSSAGFDPEAVPVSASSFASAEETSDNEYIVKRIRTGRGPEGGIWLKIFPPGRRQAEKIMSKASKGNSDACQWARATWMSNAQFCLFRCSGLDVRARIFLGKQEEANNDYFFYDEFTVDSMLIGVDYLAPAPPPLPPLEEGIDSAATETMQEKNDINTYETDQNGIQSVKIKSVFHKVARGLRPTVCRVDHLPCETCSQCWNSEGAPSNVLDHSLDSSMPLAGLVFSLSLNDPLEINIDRAGLEVLGQLQGLFMKKETASAPAIPDAGSEEEIELVASTHGTRMCLPAPRRKSTTDFDVEASFPPYMQPDKIEVLGLHLAKIVVRIHVLRGDGVFDGGLSFCYWETETRCITMDLQKLSSEIILQDVRLDVGGFTATEFKGTGHNRLVSVGLPQAEVSDFDYVSSQYQPPNSTNRPPWPSTASALLSMPLPLETLRYESRERHALQMRYITLSGKDTEEERSHLNVRVGVSSVDLPFQTKDDIFVVLSEINKSVFGAPEPDDLKETVPQASANTTEKQKQKTIATESSSVMKYQVRVEGASVRMHPVIDLRLPPTVFCGEMSSECGIFFETMLQRMEFAYGERAQVQTSRRGSLSRLAALPEGVRLRILLFVNDLGPLESALGLKHESNSFLRYRSVNKGIVKAAKRSSKLKRKKSKSRMTSDRRQEILTELMSMDDAALRELWSLHQKSNANQLKDVSKRKPT